MKRALSPAEIELLDGVDAQIQACGDALVETGNPYYAWQAIKLYGFYKKDFPRWVREYLVRCCAARICSKQASKTGDLRKVLPRASLTYGMKPSAKSGQETCSIPTQAQHPISGSRYCSKA